MTKKLSCSFSSEKSTRCVGKPSVTSNQASIPPSPAIHLEQQRPWSDSGIALLRVGANAGVLAASYAHLFPLVMGFAVVSEMSGAYLSTRRRRHDIGAADIEALRKENSQLQDAIDIHQRQNRAAAESILRLWHEQLGFTESERITLYGTKGDYLISRARYSPNDRLRAFRQMKYPKNFGGPGIALMEGEIFAANLPDPKRSYDEYFNAVKSHKKSASCYRLTKRDGSKLSMKPRSYAAFGIKNTTDGHSIGVIEFASLHPETVQVGPLRRFLGGAAPRVLSVFL